MCGIKWKRYTSPDNIYCVDPLEDPVLISFSKCLSSDILCVWRRAPPRRKSDADDLNLLGGQLANTPSFGREPNTSFFHHNKELWIFWYGDVPDVNTLLTGLTGKFETIYFCNGCIEFI